MKVLLLENLNQMDLTFTAEIPTRRVIQTIKYESTQGNIFLHCLGPVIYLINFNKWKILYEY